MIDGEFVEAGFEDEDAGIGDTAGAGFRRFAGARLSINKLYRPLIEKHGRGLLGDSWDPDTIAHFNLTVLPPAVAVIFYGMTALVAQNRTSMVALKGGFHD